MRKSIAHLAVVNADKTHDELNPHAYYHSGTIK